MVSKKSGHLFEKRLVVKFIETEGTVGGGSQWYSHTCAQYLDRTTPVGEVVVVVVDVFCCCESSATVLSAPARLPREGGREGGTIRGVAGWNTWEG